MIRWMSLFLLVMCTAAAPLLVTASEETKSTQPVTVRADADGVQRVTILLDSYSYSPEHIIVQAGKPVELVLTSVTTIIPHNFILQDKAADLAIERDVSSGRTLTVQFTPKQKGTFTFYCDKKLLFFPSHREKGMEGKLEVQ